MRALHWRLIPLLLFILLLFFLWRGITLEPHKLPFAQLGKPLPEFVLPSLGETTLFTPQQMRGQVVLLNVWASWCAACSDEQVFLMHLARTAVPIYGLNYKDNSRNAQRWLSEWGNPYQAVGEDKEGRVAIDLGVYGTPETFLIDKKGIIRYRHAGVLDESVWRADFLPRINQLKGET